MKGTFNKKGQKPVWMLHESNENEEGEQNRKTRGSRRKKKGGTIMAAALEKRRM
jgi:hypothetical protein